uniref:Alpha-soluble NSF attachment protein n=1 Tax=Arcella intermedia TaxID=1963864 RepID=A0A6B2LCY7_9EUKA
MEMEAEKKLKSFSWFGDSKQKFEAAGELYTKASNSYLLAKKPLLAGAALTQAANCYLNTNITKYEAASCYVKAANCYKKENSSAAVESMNKAIALYTEDGRFNMAAKYEKELAELLEAENEFQSSLQHYQTASEYFEHEGSTSSANSCLLKVAHFSASLQNFRKAIEIFEQVATTSLSNNLLKWSVKEYFLKAGLCHLAEGDVVGAKKALDRYAKQSPDFNGSREHKFLIQLTEAFENFDQDEFKNAVGEFDSISKLDEWKSAILVTISEKLKEDEEEDLT